MSQSSLVLYNYISFFSLGFMWMVWREKNNHTVNGIDLSTIELKFLVLRTLYKWSNAFGNVSSHPFVDFIDCI